MRQSITQKEWGELSDSQQLDWVLYFLCGAYDVKKIQEEVKIWGSFEKIMFDTACEHQFVSAPTIGEIWEVLENKIECIFAQSEKGTWVVDINDRASLPKQFENKEPIVALWEAYKFTLTL